MKKTLLTALFASVFSLCAIAQDAPNVKLTIAVDGTSHDLGLALDANAKPKKLRIDWGDGKMNTTEEIPAFDGYNQVTVTGTPVGTGEIKIYDAEELSYLECVSRIDGTQFTSLDVTAAPKLTELTANMNSLSVLNLSKNPLLTKLDINSNKLTQLDLQGNTALTTLNIEKNAITKLDLSKNTALTSLRVSYNQLEDLNVSMLTNLKALYALNCGLKSVTLGDKLTKLASLSLNNNELTEFDASKLTGLSNKGSLFLIGNKIRKFNLGNITPRSLNISKNLLTFATLGAYAKTQVTNYTYSPQQPMAVAETITDRLDLSAQTGLQGLADAPRETTYGVKTVSGITLEEGTDYKVEKGVIIFLKDQTEKLYVTMLSKASPKFNTITPFKTTEFALAKVNAISNINASTADAPIYTIAGVRVNAKAHQLPVGVYIIGGKKVVIK